MLKRASARPLPVLVSVILAVGIACVPQTAPTLEGPGVATGPPPTAASPGPITTPTVAPGQTATQVAQEVSTRAAAGDHEQASCRAR